MKGFTLIEVLVSVAIFALVMVIALGALLAISTSDRKAESVKSIINNLNFSIDSMSRAIRTGTGWECPIGNNSTESCPSGSNSIQFTPQTGVGTVYYRLESQYSDTLTNAQTTCQQTTLSNPGCIVKSFDGSTWLPITSPDVVIQDCSVANVACNNVVSYLFYVVGAAPGPDIVQPKIVMTLSGFVIATGGATSELQCGTTGNQCSIFHLQTTITQRIYDL